MRTRLRLAASALIAFTAAAPAAAIAATYDATGAMVEEHELTTYEKLTSLVSATDMAILLIAFVLPGIPKLVFWPFAGLVLLSGYEFAVCYGFAYYLLQWLIGGHNAYD